jgi:hypothetical protein
MPDDTAVLNNDPPLASSELRNSLHREETRDMLWGGDFPMFDRFKSKTDKSEGDLTSLHLGAEAAAPQPVTGQQGSAGKPQELPPDGGPGKAAAAGPTQQPVIGCPAMMFTLQAAGAYAAAVQQHYEELKKSEQRPALIFYLAYPQQGHPVSVTTTDGSKTILLLFRSTPGAKAYAAARAPGSVVAACKLEALPEQEERWEAAGLNFFALDPCSRCQGMSIAMMGRLRAEDEFLHSWNLETATRRVFGQMFLRNWQANMAKTNLTNAAILQGFRDHVDPGNAHLNLLIAGCAGMNSDKARVVDARTRLADFGPEFAGMVPEEIPGPGDMNTWTPLLTGGMVPLMAGYGVIQIPAKPREA